MFNLKSKVLFGVSVSMVLAMAIGSFALGENQTQASPQAVGATAGPFTVNGGTQGINFDYSSPVLTIHSGNLTVSTNGETAEQIVVDGAATITLEGVNISTAAGPALQIQDDATFDVNILLADGSNNILKTTKSNYAGLQKNGSGDNIGTLTIGVPDGSAGTGKLQANGGYYGAGIGGGSSGSASNITISGGVVTANGGGTAAGIGGGGNSGSGSGITITGGEVTANGGLNGAGIGGGWKGSGSNIAISGGVVTATGGSYGAGIGGGYNGSGSNITINGGVVTATGGSYGAGIGGATKDGQYIAINGGVVTATGGKNAAGIGGGDGGSGSNNSLNGDVVVLATSGSASKDALEGFVDAQQQSLLTQGIAFTRQTTSGTWSGAMYGDVTLSQDLEIPANLTVPAGQILSIKEDKDVTLSEETGAKYTVEGELRNNGIVTLPDDLEVNDEGKVTTAITYDAQDGRITNADEYKTYQDSSEVKTYSELPNAEKNGYIFEGWYTEKNGEGTKVEETSLVLLNQHILYANWTANPEPIPDPSVDPGYGGDASSKTGDSFTGIAALAILGVATTGAALLRKRK